MSRKTLFKISKIFYVPENSLKNILCRRKLSPKTVFKISKYSMSRKTFVKIFYVPENSLQNILCPRKLSSKYQKSKIFLGCTVLVAILEVLGNVLKLFAITWEYTFLVPIKEEKFGGGPTPFLANPPPKLQKNGHVGMAMPVFGRPKSSMGNGQKQARTA